VTFNLCRLSGSVGLQELYNEAIYTQSDFIISDLHGIVVSFCMGGGGKFTVNLVGIGGVIVSGLVLSDPRELYTPEYSFKINNLNSTFFTHA